MNQRLEEFFRSLADQELLARVQGGLTDQALEMARAEMARRKLESGGAPTGADPQPEAYRGDFVILERDLAPTEAHMLCSCLQAAGIHADAGDTHIVQAHGLLAVALGGAKVRVPRAQLAEAGEVLAAYRRGDFELGDDFDVGEARA